MAKKQRHITPSLNFSTFVCDINCDNSSAFFKCKEGAECSYAITDEQGRILLKGTFTEELKLDIRELPKGFYTAVLFNGSVIENFPFKI